MATKPKAVPWEEVVDVCGDLFGWLVANRHAERAEPHVTAAVRILGVPSCDPLVAAVAQGLVRVELYRSADQRNDAHAAFAGSGVPDELHELLFDFSIEQRGERDVRALAPRLAEIRRLIEKTEARKIRRSAMFSAAPLEVMDRQLQEATLQHVLASLREVGEATERLLRSYRQFSPATTEYPLTFAGWKQFEKAIRAELTKRGFTWPD